MMMHLSQSNIDSAAEIAQRLQEMFCQNATLSQEVQLVNAYSCVWHKSSDMSTPYNKRTHDATWRIRTPFSNPPMPKQRIKIAYVSSGFGNHATGFLTHSIFAHHDKSRFDVIAISLSPCDASSEWTQMESNVDKLLCIGKEINSEDLCSMIRGDGIHILVDLDGYTLDSRPELFAWRAAPIQISMCSAGPPSGIDYVVADKYSLPSGMLPHYSEKVLYVPHFPNSYTQTESCGIDFDEIDRYKIREEYGIPEESLVYACFAQPYKITPDVFAAWMNILNAVPNSQLILIRYSQVMERNLRKEIAKYSIAQDRVLFWDLVPRREHMVRSCIVDVVLDTISSGVAASYDAIWTNTPLVTMAGENMMSRLGASVLNYLGLEQLIASDLERYIQIAVSLSDDEDKYMGIIRMLEDSRDNGDLFDCKLWVGCFEKELEKCIHQHFHPVDNQCN
jgi:protein O-GlcNAc transferase